MKGLDVKSIVQVLGNIGGNSWCIILTPFIFEWTSWMFPLSCSARNKSVTAEMCLRDIVFPVLFIIFITSKRGKSVHLEMTPQALVFLLTTRGSLTYIGSYISGAKSTLENSQVSSRTWAMSWMFGHEREVGGRVGWLPSGFFPSFAPNENGHSTPSCFSAAGPRQVASKRTTRSWILEACSIFTFRAMFFV